MALYKGHCIKKETEEKTRILLIKLKKKRKKAKYMKDIKPWKKILP